MTPARKVLAAAAAAVALFAAVVVQLTMVNRLPLPGRAVPDLVLLLVTAIAVATTPALAAITGFAAGLAVDVAPPASHDAGAYALVFCLAAYAASRVNQTISDRTGEHDPVIAFTVMAGAAAAGEAGKAALGMLLSDPEVTTAVVSRVLPGAVLYDLLLSPLAFLLVARLTRGAAPERAPEPKLGPDLRSSPVFRLASAGAVPKLRLAGTGTHYQAKAPARRPQNPRHLRLAGPGKDYRVPSVAGRAPKSRLSGTGSRSASRTVRGSSGRLSAPLPAGRARKLSFAGDRPARATARPARLPGKNWLRGTRGYLPGGRPPVPPGARPMATIAVAPVARRRRLFRGRSPVFRGAGPMATTAIAPGARRRRLSRGRSPVFRGAGPMATTAIAPGARRRPLFLFRLPGRHR